MAQKGLTLIALLVLVGGCAGAAPTPGVEDRTTTPGMPPTESGAPAGGAAADTQGPGTAPLPRATQAEPAVPTLALLQQSERAAADGNVAEAIAYVERAIRLNPRDGNLWLRLGRLHLRTGEPLQAEQMAQRALGMASGQPALQRDAWLLIADVRDTQGRADEAAEIRSRWRTYRG
ncbi:MAG: tetratricopeptide repeat protein [Pseudomonadales bacterium]